MKGGVSLVVSPPPPPPPRSHQGQQLTFFKLSASVLKASKVSLKVVQKPKMKVFDPVGKIVPVNPVVDAASMEVQLSVGDEDVVFPPASTSALPPQKKAKLSAEVAAPRDPRLRAKVSHLSKSPDLHHKVPSGAEKPFVDERGGGDDLVQRDLESVVQQPGSVCKVPAAVVDLRHGVFVQSLVGVVKESCYMVYYVKAKFDMANSGRSWNSVQSVRQSSRV